MLTWLWDVLFTRRVWTEIDRRPYRIKYKDHEDGGYVHTLRDQWGNLKSIRIGTTNR